MFSLLRVSFQNLSRQRWLAFVLALSISIPLMAYLVLNAVHSDLKQRYDHLSQTFLVVERGGTMGEFFGSRLPLEMGGELKAGGASLVEPQIRTVTGTSLEEMVLLRGISLETYHKVEPFHLVAGRPLQPGDPARRAMVGINLAQTRNAYPGGTINLRGREFEVQAVFSTGTYSDYEAWISLSDAQQLLGWENDVSIFIIPAGEALRAGDFLPGGIAIIKMGESGTNLVDEFRQFFEIFGFITIILGISAAVNLGNALWRLAWQHRRELAVLQAVGFSRRSLAVYVGFQGVVITLLGFLFGVGEGAIVITFSSLHTAGITINPSLDLRTILLCLVYALGVLLVSTALPVGWLARLNLVELLRAE